MVKLTKIYTRGGDRGQTSLGDGARVAKHALRVAAYGAVDEANAALGVARLACLEQGVEPALGDFLTRVQNDLFDVGADLCTPEAEQPKHPPLRVTEGQVTALEREIDRLNAELAPLSSFVLPGGSLAGAQLHVARTAVRRAEREITRLAEAEPVTEAALKYVNRLSDLLFVAARWVNGKGAGDELWKPGANR